MEIKKYHAAEVLYRIKHNLRELPTGKSYGNEEIDPTLSGRNYSLLDTRKKASQVNKERLQAEKEIFKYNRKNLVHAVEVVIQCPSDCIEEAEKERFFKASFDYICSTLPQGRDCVFCAEVHRDEHLFATVIEDGKEVIKDISKEHLHIMYIPTVKCDPETHKGFEYKLNADALTKRAALKQLHPNLQAHLDKEGIKATVYRKKEGDGKTIPLSVSQLKTLTKEFGITLDKSLTVEKLAEFIKAHEFSKEIGTYQASISEKDRLISDLKQQLSKFHEMDLQKVAAVSPEQLRQKDAKIEQLTAKVQDLEKSNSKLQEALQKEISRNQELQKSHAEVIPAKDWGNSHGWGQSNTFEEEKLW